MDESWDADRMLELGRRHASLEARRELDALMETLVADPVYEFHPLGLRLSGGARVRRYYRQFFENFMESIVDYKLIEEWVNETSVTQEYDIAVEVEGVRETHRVLGILCTDGSLLAGERIYGSERVIRLMAGKMFTELEPLPT